MALRTTRLGESESEPLSLEVSSQLTPASTLLLWLEGLSGLRVVSKKSWAITDDFEAYFVYKGRLFVMYTPFVNVWISLIGQPPDDQVFSEVELRVRGFRCWYYLLAPFAIARYFLVPFNPPKHLLERHTDSRSWYES